MEALPHSRTCDTGIDMGCKGRLVAADSILSCVCRVPRGMSAAARLHGLIHYCQSYLLSYPEILLVTHKCTDVACATDMFPGGFSSLKAFEMEEYWFKLDPLSSSSVCNTLGGAYAAPWGPAKGAGL